MMEKKFVVPVFDFAVYVTDFEHACKLEELEQDGRGLGGAVYWRNGKLCVYVAKVRKSVLGSYIAHESVHVAAEIMRIVGAPVNGDNQETLAYLVQYVYAKIAEILKGEKKK